MTIFLCGVPIIWRRIFKLAKEVGVQTSTQGLKYGRLFGALMFPMLQRCLFGKPAKIYFLLRKISSVGELWETKYALFALLRLS
jgi:hypothetical protein